MENATKALLIAAAILIVILLISIGVGVFNAAQEQMGNVDLTEYQIQEFNNKFTKYEGTNVSGSKVNAMLKTVFNHNLANDDPVMRIRVGLNGGGNSNGTDASNGGTWLIMREQFYERLKQPTVPALKKYTVKVVYDTKTKLIYQIDVNEK